MTDDPAFASSYRNIRRARRIDPSTRRLLGLAGGIGAVVVVGIGGWSLVGRGPGAVPVIAAPSGPMRVKPAHPGGMTVIGANPDVTADGSGQSGVTMQSGPETPALAALHALEAKVPAAEAPSPAPSAAAKPGVAAASLAVSPPTPALVPAPSPAPAQASAATPAPVVAPAASAAAASPPPPSATAVQLAAMGSREAAMAAWEHLSQKMPALLAQHQPVVERAEVGGRTVWRLRTSGFATIAVATRFCQQVRAQGSGCTIAAF